MKFELTFNAATYRVSHAEPDAGQSVVMNASHVNQDGTLVPMPYLAKGRLVAIDSAGQFHYFEAGDSAQDSVFAAGHFSMTAIEKADYWCTNPLPGNRIVREGRLIVRPNFSEFVEKTYEVNALFTAPALVNGVNVDKGKVVKFSPGRKNISNLNETEPLHVILFRTEPVDQ